MNEKTETIKVNSVDAYQLINCLQNELIVVHADKIWIRILSTKRHQQLLTKAHVFWVYS